MSAFFSTDLDATAGKFRPGTKDALISVGFPCRWALRTHPLFDDFTPSEWSDSSDHARSDYRSWQRRDRETFYGIGLLTRVGENDLLVDIGCLDSVGWDSGCCNLVLSQRMFSNGTLPDD